MNTFWVIAGIGAALLVLWRLVRPKDQPMSPLIKSTTFGAAEFFNGETCQEQELVSGAGIPLGFYSSTPLHYQGERHLVTVAPTRTGKGTTAQIPTLLEHDASLFMIDPKGENAAIAARYRRDVMGHEVFILNPFGVMASTFAALGFEASARFNPLATFDPTSETFLAEVAALGEALIVTEGKDPHWSDSARDLIAARMLWACAYGEPEDATLPAVRDFLSASPEAFGLAIATMAECDDPIIKNKAMRFIKARPELDSIISTAQTQTAFLDDPCLRESLSGNDFRFLDLKRRKMTVFLILPAKLIPVYFRWFRLLVVSALNELLSTPEKGDKPVLLMLDEFASLGHLSSVENAMGLAAGYGVQLWPFVQDIHQLEDIYGKRWKSFLANAGIQQYFTPNDMDTAEFISKRAGNYTHKVRNESVNEISRGQAQHGFTGRNYSYHEIARPLLDPLEVLDLPASVGIIFMAGCMKTLRYDRFDYRKNEKYAGRWDANPYFTPKAGLPMVTGATASPSSEALPVAKEPAPA